MLSIFFAIVSLSATLVFAEPQEASTPVAALLGQPGFPVFQATPASEIHATVAGSVDCGLSLFSVDATGCANAISSFLALSTALPVPTTLVSGGCQIGVQGSSPEPFAVDADDASSALSEFASAQLATSTGDCDVVLTQIPFSTDGPDVNPATQTTAVSIAVQFVFTESAVIQPSTTPPPV